MAVKVLFEIGHIASLKSKITPEGFTHDWELYVRGCDSNDMSYCIDKVVFNLHESFPKPKRTFKEPPYVLKESGYAGFVLPIDIYFKNEPKKVTYQYDLNLQNTGTIQESARKSYTFKNPSDEFRRKLYKYGGVSFNNTSMNQDDKARESADERSQLISKPKLSGTESSGGKKYKNKSDEPKVNNSFATLFGPPITKTTSISKVSPDPKTKTSPSSSSKSQLQKGEKPPKDKLDKEKKEKNKHSSPTKDKVEAKDLKKLTEEKHDKREEKKKDKTHSKERDKSKDKQIKRNLSPKPRSPKRQSPPRSSSAASKGEDSMSSTSKISSSKYSDTDRLSSSVKKSKKEKKEKSHDKDRDRERKDKEHKLKEERATSKASDKLDVVKKDGSNTPKDIFKEKIKHQEPKISPSEVVAPPIIPETVKPPPVVPDKKTEKDPERKHKHKKKEKNKDKDKEHSKERKKEKNQKIKDDTSNTIVAAPVTLVKKEIALPLQNKINPLNALLDEMADKGSSDSEEEHTVNAAEKPDLAAESSSSLPDVVVPKPLDESKSEKNEKEKSEKTSKRSRKEGKGSGDKDEKKKKRKSKEEAQLMSQKRKSPSPSLPEPPVKQMRKEELNQYSNTSSIPTYSTPHSPQSVLNVNEGDRNLGQVGVISNSVPSIKSSTSPAAPVRASPSPVRNIASPLLLAPPASIQQPSSLQPLSNTPINTGANQNNNSNNISTSTSDYMSELKDLQHKIMTLQDNNELQQVVEMIATTGCYEITTKTFDFDLCALDRSTVQRLQDFFSTSCS